MRIIVEVCKIDDIGVDFDFFEVVGKVGRDELSF